MPEEDKTDVKSPFQQILEKINTLEAENKALNEKVSHMEGQFKDFSDFNASLLNQGSGQPSQSNDDEAKRKRRQYLDDLCRKGAMK